MVPGGAGLSADRARRPPLDARRGTRAPRRAPRQWCRFRTVYSTTTIPFLLARLPIVDRVLGHHRPTAYTQYGKCVPKRKVWPWYPKPPEPEPEGGEEKGADMV